jgi:Cupin-like domain
MASTVKRRTKVIEGLCASEVNFAELLAANVPVILRGLAGKWPLVQKGKVSAEQAIAYLKTFDGGKPLTRFAGSPEIKGRFFYNDEMTALNFASARVPFAQFVDEVEASFDDANPASYYIGSTDIETYFPGLDDANRLPLDDAMFQSHPPLRSIWIGNRTIASCHYDMSHNIACCVAGRRRFTLFPPDQISNLYPGPLEPTPGGQVVSMVNFADPDHDRYPLFAEAVAAAQVAELEAGDVLFYPALWWHHVEALEAFNVLINYWWNTSPAFMDTPQNALLHAMLSLRDRPAAEKEAWRALFDYYIFGEAKIPAMHLPPHIQGVIGELDDIGARRLRATLINKLNR